MTVNPTTGATSFTAGAITVCQNAPDETYTATAANSTTITYSVLPAAAGLINSSTGVMNWDAAFSGMATITATSTGLCGTTSADRDVTVNPSTGPTTFTGGATTVCQDAADETYTATAANSTSIAFSVFPATAGVIDAVSGVMNWNAAFFGSAMITATSTGLCGTTSASVIVTVNPSTGPTTFTLGAVTICQDAPDGVYAATAANSTSIVYSVLPAAAGTINAATGLMNWDAAFSGTATITATSTGLCGTTSADRIVTVNPSTGPTLFTAGSTTLCQDAADETYTATAANSISIIYSVLPAGAGSINPLTGLMNWNPGFSGLATITATSTGLCTTTSANRVVTVNPSTGSTIFTAGPVAVCQDAANATYTATALHSVSIAYSVSPGAAGTIDAVSGVMDWDAAFFGTATITATSTGLCTTTSADRVVTVNPTIGATSFIAGATTVCQNAPDETYTATAVNSTSVAYAVLPAAAGVINPVSGVMNWNAAFFGSATITATSTGLCGTSSADQIVTVNPSTGPTTFTGGPTTVCQDAADATYTATAPNSTSIAFSVSPAAAGTIDAVSGVMNWDAAFSGTATITATSTGLCGTTSADREVTVNPLTGVTTFTGGATTICQDSPDEIYTAMAANSITITYSVLPAAAGIINPVSGVMNWDAAFFGVATITATSTGLCSTTIADIVVTVNPMPNVSTVSPTTICSASTTNIALTSNVASATFSWTIGAVTGGISGASASSGSTISQILVNSGTSPGTVTYRVTPAANSCTGTPVNIVVTVNPTPNVSVVGQTTICSGTATNISLGSNVGGTTFSWTVGPITGAISGATASNGVNISQSLTNTGTSAGTVTYIVTPDANGCPGNPVNIVVTVNPTPDVSTVSSTTICSSTATNIVLTGGVTGTTFSWTIGPITGAVGGATASNGSTIAQTLFNPGLAPGTVTYIVTPVANSCAGVPLNIVVTVNPLTGPTSFSAGTLEVCQDAPDETYTATATNSISIVYSVSPAAAGVINPASGVMNWDAAFSGTATITATSAGLCGTTVGTLPVKVKGLPEISSSPVDRTICEFGMVDFDVTATGSDLMYQWYVDDNSGLGFVPVTGGSYTGETSPTLQIWSADRSMSGYKYHVVVSGCLPDVISGTAVLTVNQGPELTLHPSDAVVCLGDNTFMAADATGTGILWQWYVNKGSGFVVVNDDANFSGAATSTLTITNALSSFNNWFFRAKATGVCGAPVFTNFGRLNVTNPPTAGVLTAAKSCMRE